jgi:hypothetical protein
MPSTTPKANRPTRVLASLAMMSSAKNWKKQASKMNTFKDTDLREALRRKYTNTLTLLANLKESIMERLARYF